MNRAKHSCDECESPYFIDSSKMMNLCPNCAHELYGYPDCIHDFKDENCIKCGWDGHESDYIEGL